MPASKPIEELRAQAAALILERAATTSVSKVASDLGISRQAVYDIRKGKYCPSLALIQRACAAWHEEFNIRGLPINQYTLWVTKKPKAVPRQMSLFEALQGKRFEVKTRRAGNTMELVLRFKLSA